MATEFGTGKSIFILAIVLGCFAILWPKIFYPMLQDTVTVKPNVNHQEHLRQERPPHLRPDMMHPALKEKGQAISVPQAHIVPKLQEREAPGRPMPPMPGMRPPMGGAGHVVPPPKGGGTMGIIMPLYTIGIVIFFMYTMMKLIFKKSDDPSGYKDLEPDPEFRRVVFNEIDCNRTNIQSAFKDNEENKAKLGWKEGAARDLELDQLRRRLEETEKAMERIVAQMESVPQKIKSKRSKPTEPAVPSIEDSEDKETKEKVEEEKSAKVQVIGMEMTESIEGGQRWSRPPTPISRSATPIPPVLISEPQNIFLEGSLPSQSQLLVSQSETQTLPLSDDDDSSVILAGKVTLSLIGVDAGAKTDKGEITVDSSVEKVEDKTDVEGEVEEEEVEEEEIEEEDEESEEVSEDEAEVEDGINGDEDPTTNYTTASAVGADETVGDYSLADALLQDAPVYDEENGVEEEEAVNGQEDIEEDEIEEEEEEEEGDGEEEDEEETQPQGGQPQTLQHQHQR